MRGTSTKLEQENQASHSNITPPRSVTDMSLLDITPDVNSFAMDTYIVRPPCFSGAIA